MYVFDTSAISALHKNFYRSRFVSLWEQFDTLVENNKITSTREALRELEDHGGHAYDWAINHQHLFATPNSMETRVVAQIYGVKHFQGNIEQKKLIGGGKNADPFIIARASITKGTVVTLERFKPHGAKIPNICQHFDIPYLDLQGFMESENWVF